MGDSRERPEWLRGGGAKYVEFPEPPQVQRYHGGQPANVEEAYEALIASDALRRLKAAGAELVSVRFFSGFGLEFEAYEFERGRDFAVRAHELGLKVAARISLGWAVPETLIQEEPDSQNWMQLTHDGKSVWGTQSYQCRPCYNSEGWLRYVEKAAGIAADAGADLILFDGAGYSPTVRACHCPLCVASFRDFLRKKYGAQEVPTRHAGQERFGHNSFIHVRPPVESVSSEVTAPHQQEWVLFKIRTVTDALARVARFVRRRSPLCAVGAEVFDTFFAAGAEYLFGIDAAQWLPLLDAAFMREPRLEFPAEWTNSDREHRAINTNLAAKVARAHGAVVLDMLQPPAPELPEPPRMAVFHDAPSAAFNSSCADCRHELETRLLARGVPFDVLHAGNLEKLKNYPCAVLANCECLSDVLARAFEDYAHEGGGLIATEQTGRRDPWRRKRPQNALTRALGPDPTATVFKEFGKGRAAYLPRTSDEWDDFEDCVRWLMGEEKQEPGDRSQESGVRGQESGDRGQESGVKSQESESGGAPVAVAGELAQTTVDEASH